MTAFAPLRRSDGTLVAADRFAAVESMPLADAAPHGLWRGRKGDPSLPVGTPGKSATGDLAASSGYGRAWWDREQDIPRHASAGRAEVLTTDRDLQLGPEPGRIRRINQANAGALIGPDQNSLPVDANWGYLPHQKVGKLATGTHATLRTIADDAWMPGVFAGNPLP